MRKQNVMKINDVIVAITKKLIKELIYVIEGLTISPF
jgi:hypothetical protein